MKAQKILNKVFEIILKFIVLLSQCTLLMPVIYDGKTNSFRTHSFLTFAAILKCVILGLVAPSLLFETIKMYPTVKQHNDAYIIIIGVLIFDVCASLLVMSVLIWKRQKLAMLLNIFKKLTQNLALESDHNWINGRIFLFLLLKITLMLYEFLVNVPYLLRRQWSHLFTGLISNYLSNYILGAITSMNIFLVILLINALLQYMAKRLEKLQDCLNSKSTTSYNQQHELERWLEFEGILQKTSIFFNRNFQLVIFLLLLRYFLNLLANLYGFFYVYLRSREWKENNVIYCAKFVAELYGLIYISHYCSEIHRKVKQLLLCIMLDFDSRKNEGTTTAYLETSGLWLHEMDFRIFGMFSLNHEFWLTLLVYATNFIVIISQFAYIEIKQIK